MSFGMRWADTTRASAAMPKRWSTPNACCMMGQSLDEPIIMPTTGSVSGRVTCTSDIDMAQLLGYLCQFARGIAARHVLQGNRLDLAGSSGRAELFVTLLANALGRFTCGFQELARIKFRRVLEHEPTYGGGHGQADIRVDIYLANAVLDGFLNFLHWHTIGFFEFATKLANLVEQLLWHTGAAVHNQVRVGQVSVDFLHALNRKDVASGLARKFVGTMAGSNGNSQRIQLCATNEVNRLFGVGKQLIHGKGAFGAMAVFLVTHHGLQRSQATQLAFYGNAHFVRHFDDGTRHVDVVLVVGNGFPVFFQGAVHHDAGKAQVDGAAAHGGRLTMVLVHHDGNVRVGFDGSLNQMLQEAFAGIFTGTC